MVYRLNGTGVAEGVVNLGGAVGGSGAQPELHGTPSALPASVVMAFYVSRMRLSSVR